MANSTWRNVVPLNDCTVLDVNRNTWIYCGNVQELDGVVGRYIRWLIACSLRRLSEKIYNGRPKVLERSLNQTLLLLLCYTDLLFTDFPYLLVIPFSLLLLDRYKMDAG